VWSAVVENVGGNSHLMELVGAVSAPCRPNGGGTPAGGTSVFRAVSETVFALPTSFWLPSGTLPHWNEAWVEIRFTVDGEMLWHRLTQLGPIRIGESDMIVAIQRAKVKSRFATVHKRGGGGFHADRRTNRKRTRGDQHRNAIYNAQ
jgi:hypothetical protein